MKQKSPFQLLGIKAKTQVSGWDFVLRLGGDTHVILPVSELNLNQCHHVYGGTEAGSLNTFATESLAHFLVPIWQQ